LVNLWVGWEAIMGEEEMVGGKEISSFGGGGCGERLTIFT